MAINPVPFSENGGFSATTFFMFMPATFLSNGAPFIAIFDPSDFNDDNDASSYSWRVEDVVVGRIPVVRRVVLVYTDLGNATITVTLSGTNDSNNKVTASRKISIGTDGKSGELLTKFVDISLTAFRPQLTISREANAGPVSIISATLIGEVEEVSF